MFVAMDAGMAVLSGLMLALGAVPALLALSSQRARTPLSGTSKPPVTPHGLFFGAATAARAGRVTAS